MTRLSGILSRWSIALVVWPWLAAAFVTWNHGTRIA